VQLVRIDNGLICAFLDRQPEPPAGVLNDPSCYHFPCLTPVFRSALMGIAESPPLLSLA